MVPVGRGVTLIRRLHGKFAGTGIALVETYNLK
jgi:hypothetical protein